MSRQLTMASHAVARLVAPSPRCTSITSASIRSASASSSDGARSAASVRSGIARVTLESARALAPITGGITLARATDTGLVAAHRHTAGAHPGHESGPPLPAGPVGPSGIDVFFERLRRLGVARATQGKVAGGVCAGLARRWNIDPLVARLVFVVLTVFGGFGLLAYLVALAMLPDEKGTIFAEEALRRRHGGAIFLVFIIAVMTVREFFDRWWVWLAIPLALAAWWIVRGAAAGKSPRQLGSEAKTHAAEAADAVRGWGAATPPTPAPPLSAPYQPTYQAPPPYQPYPATPVSHATPTSPAAHSSRRPTGRWKCMSSPASAAK